MIFLFLLLFYFSLGNLTFATHVPKCIAAHSYIIISTCQNEILYNTSYDIKVELSGDLEFPNKMSFLNFTEWSLDPSQYFRNVSYVFQYDETSKVIGTWEPKYALNKSFNFPNAKISWSSEVIGVDTTYPVYIGVDEIFIDNRNMFGYGEGNLASYSKPCFYNYSTITCNSASSYIISGSSCCTNFEYIDVPDSAQNVCDLYESNSFIYNTSGTYETMKVFYGVISNDDLYINVTNFTSFTPNGYQLDYNGDSGWIYGCNGNTTNPQSSCRAPIWSRDEFQINIDFFLYKPYEQTYGINIAKFINRNGIYLKDDYSLFTPSSPCWNVSSPIPYSDGKMGNNSFCCIHFMDKSTTTTPQPTSTISLTTLTSQTTTTPPLLTTPPPGSCILYNSTTNVLDDSAYLEVNYELDETTMIVKIKNYFASKDSNVSIEAFNTITFSQSCRASTASPENTCYFTLSADNQYELKMRTSTMPDGFNMLQIIEEKGQIIVPKLNPQNPCYSETNPYNDGTSNLQATTVFCCSAFA